MPSEYIPKTLAPEAVTIPARKISDTLTDRLLSPNEAALSPDDLALRGIYTSLEIAVDSTPLKREEKFMSIENAVRNQYLEMHKALGDKNRAGDVTTSWDSLLRLTVVIGERAYALNKNGNYGVFYAIAAQIASEIVGTGDLGQLDSRLILLAGEVMAHIADHVRVEDLEASRVNPSRISAEAILKQDDAQSQLAAERLAAAEKAKREKKMDESAKPDEEPEDVGGAAAAAVPVPLTSEERAAWQEILDTPIAQLRYDAADTNILRKRLLEEAIRLVRWAIENQTQHKDSRTIRHLRDGELEQATELLKKLEQRLDRREQLQANSLLEKILLYIYFENRIDAQTTAAFVGEVGKFLGHLTVEELISIFTELTKPSLIEQISEFTDKAHSDVESDRFLEYLAGCLGNLYTPDNVEILFSHASKSPSERIQDSEARKIATNEITSRIATYLATRLSAQIEAEAHIQQPLALSKHDLKEKSLETVLDFIRTHAPDKFPIVALSVAERYLNASEKAPAPTTLQKLIMRTRSLMSMSGDKPHDRQQYFIVKAKNCLQAALDNPPRQLSAVAKLNSDQIKKILDGLPFEVVPDEGEEVSASDTISTDASADKLPAQTVASVSNLVAVRLERWTHEDNASAQQTRYKSLIEWEKAVVAMQVAVIEKTIHTDEEKVVAMEMALAVLRKLHFNSNVYAEFNHAYIQQSERIKSKSTTSRGENREHREQAAKLAELLESVATPEVIQDPNVPLNNDLMIQILDTFVKLLDTDYESTLELSTIEQFLALLVVNWDLAKYSKQFVKDHAGETNVPLLETNGDSVDTPPMPQNLTEAQRAMWQRRTILANLVLSHLDKLVAAKAPISRARKQLLIEMLDRARKLNNLADPTVLEHIASIRNLQESAA